MTSRVAQLLRSNIALALLCVIAIGVLVILFREPGRSGEAPIPKAQNVPAVVQTGTPGAPAPESSNGPVAQASFADMPSPGHFQSFVYTGQNTLTATGTCADTYEVVMIYPSDIDYRSNPAAFEYNVAEACTAGAPFAKSIPFTYLGLSKGHSYYLIRASEGTSGTWYNPY